MKPSLMRFNSLEPFVEDEKTRKLLALGGYCGRQNKVECFACGVEWSKYCQRSSNESPCQMCGQLDSIECLPEMCMNQHGYANPFCSYVLHPTNGFESPDTELSDSE